MTPASRDRALSQRQTFNRLSHPGTTIPTYFLFQIYSWTVFVQVLAPQNQPGDLSPVIFPSVPQFPRPAKATVKTDELGWRLGPHLVHS